MPTYKTVNTNAMLAANESGSRAVREAAQIQQREAETGRQENMQLAQSVGQAMQRESEFSRQMDSENARLQETMRANRMGEAIQQDAQDIEMADRGLEQTGGQSRADRLRQDMDRGGQQTAQAQAQQDPEQQAQDQRFKKQSEQPLEVAGPEGRTLAPTEARQSETASKLTTQRMNAQANYMESVRRLKEQKAKGTGADPEVMKRELKNLEQPIKSAASLFNAGKDGDLTDSQWENIKSLAADNPDSGLQQELATKRFGPALGRFLQNRVSMAGLQYMAVDGDMPDGDLVDLASPMMQQFTTNAGLMQDYLRNADQGGMLSAAFGITSIENRNKLVRKLTAAAMMHQMANPQAGGGDTIIPSQGGRAMNPQQGQPSGPARPNPYPVTPGQPRPTDPDAQQAKREWAAGR